MYSVLLSMLLLIPMICHKDSPNMALNTQNDLSQINRINPGVPEEAISVLKAFHKAVVENDLENAKRLYYEGRIGWSTREDPTYLDFRILTFGPVPPPLIESERYPKPIKDDYVAWLEVKMNDVQWNYPHAHYQTILTKRSGEWLILTSAIIQHYAEPTLVYIPGYYPER